MRKTAFAFLLFILVSDFALAQDFALKRWDLMYELSKSWLLKIDTTGLSSVEKWSESSEEKLYIVDGKYLIIKTDYSYSPEHGILMDENLTVGNYCLSKDTLFFGDGNKFVLRNSYDVLSVEGEVLLSSRGSDSTDSFYRRVLYIDAKCLALEYNDIVSVYFANSYISSADYVNYLLILRNALK